MNWKIIFEENFDTEFDELNESVQNEIFTMESLTKLIVYQNKDKLYINIDDVEFNINIGQKNHNINEMMLNLKK